MPAPRRFVTQPGTSETEWISSRFDLIDRKFCRRLPCPCPCVPKMAFPLGSQEPSFLDVHRSYPVSRHATEPELRAGGTGGTTVAKGESDRFSPARGEPAAAPRADVDHVDSQRRPPAGFGARSSRSCRSGAMAALSRLRERTLVLSASAVRGRTAASPVPAGCGS
jgi:hypothetical protein